MSQFTFTTSHLPETIRFNIPLSKSICQRLLVIKHLKAREGITIPSFEISECEDVMLLAKNLEAIQANTSAILDCQNSATTLRFLLAVCAVTEGDWTLTALPRMAFRQIKPLVVLLNKLGGEITETSLGKDIAWKVCGKNMLSAKKTPIQLNVMPSSQIISSLLLIRNFIQNFEITIHHKQTSLGYIKMTEALIENPLQKIEKCWSSAAFAYCLMATRKRGSVIIPDLKPSTLQPDAVAEQLFRNFGVKTEFTDQAAILTFDPTICAKKKLTIDVSQCLDLYLPLKVASHSFAYTVGFVGTDVLKYKESDRLIATTNHPYIVTKGDHRIAMSCAMLAFRYDNVILDDMTCVRKSFPAFWQNFGIL